MPTFFPSPCFLSEKMDPTLSRTLTLTDAVRVKSANRIEVNLQASFKLVFITHCMSQDDE